VFRLPPSVEKVEDPYVDSIPEEAYGNGLYVPVAGFGHPKERSS